MGVNSRDGRVTQSIECLPFKHAELCRIFPEPTEDIHVTCPCSSSVVEGAEVTLGLTEPADKPNQQVPISETKVENTEEDS